MTIEHTDKAIKLMSLLRLFPCKLPHTAWNNHRFVICLLFWNLTIDCSFSSEKWEKIWIGNEFSGKKRAAEFLNSVDFFAKNLKALEIQNQQVEKWERENTNGITSIGHTIARDPKRDKICIEGDVQRMRYYNAIKTKYLMYDWRARAVHLRYEYQIGNCMQMHGYLWACVCVLCTFVYCIIMDEE